MSDTLCANTIRCFSADMVQKANSGHPGAPMGMAAMAHTLWTKVMNYSPSNPEWINRDRFVLSNGHGCALLYTMLYLTGYEEFTLNDIKSFRQVGSKTAGHPENHYAGIEVTTGPLGQGIANAVGLAAGQAHLASIYNRPGFDLFSNFTYVFCGDGCLMEGISAEAASLAGHLGLGQLIVLYDDNSISIDGSTDLAFTENVPERFKSYGWHTLIVENGDDDYEGIFSAIQKAQAETNRPSLISVKTTIGLGSIKQGTEKSHGSPLGVEDLANVKKKFGFNPDEHFHIPKDVENIYSSMKLVGNNKEQSWNKLFASYEKKYPEQASEITRRFSGKLPENWKDDLPVYKSSDDALATRKCSQHCLEKLIPKIPEMIGGSADLAPSNLTLCGEFTDFQKGQYHGRNFRFGVREHAMAAFVNGIYAYGAFLPYCATFMNFLSYLQGAITLSDLSNVKCIYIMTHDSIGLGEDGPTHQPIEKLATVRGMPNTLLFRPADGNETAGSYICALEQSSSPCVLALSRQGLPQLENSSREGVSKGAYIIHDSDSTPDIIFIATGSEVSLCISTAKEMDKNVRVVSIPCWKLFDKQSKEYALSVLPDGIPVLSVEASTTLGWSKYSHASIGMKTAGASGKGGDLYKHFGFTTSNIAEKANKLMEFYSGNPPRSPINTLDL